MSTVIFDLDHTLLDTTSFKQALATNLGLTDVAWDEAYQKHIFNGCTFDPKTYLVNFSTTQQQNFYKTLDKLNQFIYPDSLACLQRAIQAHWRVIILTYGNKEWQMLKLQHLLLPKQVEQIATNITKEIAVKKLLNQVTWLIDDNAEVIDSLKKNYPQIMTYWMKRPNGKYNNQPPQLADKIIEDLTNLTF